MLDCSYPEYMILSHARTARKLIPVLSSTLMGKLVNDFLSRPIPPEVWHYTNLAGFEGIVSSGRVWATEAHHTTDETEFIHARDVAADYFERWQPKDDSMGWAKQTARDFLSRAFDGGHLSPSQAEIFVASFCEVEDLKKPVDGVWRCGTRRSFVL